MDSSRERLASVRKKHFGHSTKYQRAESLAALSTAALPQHGHAARKPLPLALTRLFHAPDTWSQLESNFVRQRHFTLLHSIATLESIQNSRAVPPQIGQIFRLIPTLRPGEHQLAVLSARVYLYRTCLIHGLE